MISAIKFAGAAAIACGLLAGCGQSMSLAPNQADGASPSEVTFAQFRDIPIPNSAAMDVDRSFIFGAQDSWIGRMVLNTSVDSGATFDFYKSNAPLLGWEEVTSIRSAVSVLTYTRGERVLTIQIQRRTLSGSEVDLTVSPRGVPGASPGGATAGGGGIGASGLGRAPTVPVQRVP